MPAKFSDRVGDVYRLHPAPISGERTKKAAVNKALREFIARREQKDMLQLFGKLDWDKKYAYKKEKSRDELPG